MQHNTAKLKSEPFVMCNIYHNLSQINANKSDKIQHIKLLFVMLNKNPLKYDKIYIKFMNGLAVFFDQISRTKCNMIYTMSYDISPFRFTFSMNTGNNSLCIYLFVHLAYLDIKMILLRPCWD